MSPVLITGETPRRPGQRVAEEPDLLRHLDANCPRCGEDIDLACQCELILGVTVADGSVLFGAPAAPDLDGLTPAEYHRALGREVCERCEGTCDGIGWNQWVCGACKGEGYIA